MATGALLAEAVRLHRASDLPRAARLYQRILALEPSNPDALHLLGLVRHQQGDDRQAETLIRAALDRNPASGAYANSLGVVQLALKRPAEALASFDAALAGDPLYVEALNNRGNALQALERFAEALPCYEQALALRSNYAEAHSNLGRALAALGRSSEAEAAFRRAVKLKADYAKAWRYLGDVLAEKGDREEAESALRRAIALDPGDGENHAALTALLERSSRFEEALAAAARAPGNVRAQVAAARCERRLGHPDAALQRLASLPMTGGDAASRAYLLFEQAALCDAVKDFAAAYAAYEEANRLTLETAAARRIDRDAFPRLIDRLRRRFTASWVQSWSPAPRQWRRSPIFLVGFPRSGTTLLDQILDSHPALTVLEEKDPIDRIRARVEHLDGGYPDALASLGPDRIEDLRAAYWARVEAHLGRAVDGWLVDKMPLNTIDVGLIYRLFPDARIILALRHPCDVILSGFMQPFQPNAAMIHFATLAGTARFYADVMGLWLLYQQLLPLQVTTIRYENLVGDLAGETERLLTFLGLPWDDAVLDYAEHAKTRAIATPSYHQVVQPIYRRSVDRWRNYAFAFTDILPLLAPYLRAFGYEDEA